MKKNINLNSNGNIYDCSTWQAGINNASSKSTLDITGATVVCGVPVPHFTVSEFTGKDNAYVSAQNGTLVFVLRNK